MTGASGQVGSALLAQFGHAMPHVPVFAPSRAEMNLEDGASVRQYVRRTQPQWIVSSGAYTAVDAAESDRDAAWAANATAPAILAEETARMGGVMIHLSTDYVFPGTGSRPWVETDPTDPLNVYGASKLAGEQAIAAAGAAHIILRTSWVYSATGKNFVRTMLRLLATKDTPLRVVGDQHGAPTAAGDLASAIVTIMGHLHAEAERQGVPLVDAARGFTGVYHCSGSGETTWAGLAMAVRAYLSDKYKLKPADVVPVPSSEYPTAARRPGNSRLDCSRLFQVFGVRMPEWQCSVDRVLQELSATDGVTLGFNP